MSSGVEVRVPFTDHRLVDYAFQLPKSHKIHDGIAKFILRESLKVEHFFPEEIRTRTKVSPTSPEILQGLTTNFSL